MWSLITQTAEDFMVYIISSVSSYSLKASDFATPRDYCLTKYLNIQGCFESNVCGLFHEWVTLFKE